jgi:hypothetical protein
MTRHPLETEKAARTSPQPPRSYAVPGGPLAKDLGTIDVYKLAEIERGGEHDNIRR